MGGGGIDVSIARKEKMRLFSVFIRSFVRPLIQSFINPILQ